MTVILASSNRGKLAELRALLPEHVAIIGLSEAGLGSPEETGTTFEQNALLKARAALRAAPVAIADDSGLEVEALDNRPGVWSSRYAGEPVNDNRNNARLLHELAGYPSGQRAARFRSVVALVTRDGREVVAQGTLTGRIVDTPRGQHGFGYDPLFEIADPAAGGYHGQTLAELVLEEKNRISHRARAFDALLRQLRDRTDDLRDLLAPGTDVKRCNRG